MKKQLGSTCFWFCEEPKKVFVFRCFDAKTAFLNYNDGCFSVHKDLVRFVVWKERKRICIVNIVFLKTEFPVFEKTAWSDWLHSITIRHFRELFVPTNRFGSRQTRFCCLTH